MFISNLTSREKAEITEKALIALGELIILDATGHLIYISKEYAKNMHISMEDSIGRHILEVIPDSKLPEVLKTGQPILGAMYYRDNNAFWVNRIPIKENGKTVGVVAQSMLTNDLSSEKTKRQTMPFGLTAFPSKKTAKLSASLPNLCSPTIYLRKKPKDSSMPSSVS